MEKSIKELNLQERLLLEKQLHLLACEEVTLIRDRQQHEEDYRKQEVAEDVLTSSRALSDARLQNEQLKLEVLRWRKQCSIMRLKLASARENVQLLRSNIEVLCKREQSLDAESADLRLQLTRSAEDLIKVTAAKAQAQAESLQYQEQWLQADKQLTKLSEELHLVTGRCAAAGTQMTELQQQCRSVDAEKSSLQKQLDESLERETAAAAAQELLQQSVKTLQNDLKRVQKQFTDEQKARAQAEAVATKSAAAAEAAADALAVKEQQLTEWRQLDRASKETATQQLQLSQMQLEGSREKASTQEAKLLDEMAALKQQLEQERAARHAAEVEASKASKVATGGNSKVAAANKVLEGQVAELKKKVSDMQQQVAIADKKAAAAEKEAAAAAAKSLQEAQRAANLEKELEHLQEQQTTTAVQAVGDIIHSLSQDAAEQPGSAGKVAAASRARRRTSKVSAKEGATGSVSKSKVRRQVAVAVPPADDNDIPAPSLSGDDGTDNEEQDEEYQPKKQSSRATAVGKALQQGKQITRQNDNILTDGTNNPAYKAKDQTLHPAEPKEQLGGQQAAAVAAVAAGTGKGVESSTADIKKVASVGASAPPSMTLQQKELAAGRPPQLSFVPRSLTTPAAALQRPEVMAAAQLRVSATDMLKKLSSGVPGVPGKPGSRKRKLGGMPSASGNVDVIPASLLVKQGFQAPKVRRPGQ